METTLHTEWTVEDICKGFTYNELEGKGLFGLDGWFEILDGQQQKIMQSSLLVHECEGEEKEIKELLNAIYSGEFVNAAKRMFSNKVSQLHSFM